VSETLKPCPFCGKEAVATVITDNLMPGGLGQVVMCADANDCPVSPMTDSYRTKEKAVAAWNTRAWPPKQKDAK